MHHVVHHVHRLVHQVPHAMLCPPPLHPMPPWLPCRPLGGRHAIRWDLVKVMLRVAMPLLAMVMMMMRMTTHGPTRRIIGTMTNMSMSAMNAMSMILMMRTMMMMHSVPMVMVMAWCMVMIHSVMAMVLSLTLSC